MKIFSGRAPAPNFARLDIRFPFQRIVRPHFSHSTWSSTELRGTALAETARGTPSIVSVPAECVSRCRNVAGNLCIQRGRRRPFGGNGIAVHLDSLHMRIAPSTGISRLRRYSSILGALYGVAIKRVPEEAELVSLMCSEPRGCALLRSPP